LETNGQRNTIRIFAIHNRKVEKRINNTKSKGDNMKLTNLLNIKSLSIEELKELKANVDEELITKTAAFNIIMEEIKANATVDVGGFLITLDQYLEYYKK
jgi:hypothetical protein